jgi:hypothetical protein
MFWGSSSYEFKGPVHIWKAQTVAKRKRNDLELAELNEQCDASEKTLWEISTGVRRTNLPRHPAGKPPQRRWNQSTGKYIRKFQGRIDFWRHYEKVMLPKFIPFAHRCLRQRPKTIVQEDEAPAHAHTHQAPMYTNYNVAWLIWPGNSPDLNAIEPCWPWMKKVTTIRGAPQARGLMEITGRKAWKELPQTEIQA